MNEYQFNSKYSEYIKSYIEMMVSKGYKSYSFYYLKQFDDFLCANNYNEVTINKEIIDKWSIQKSTEKKNSRNDRVSRVRGFCTYLNSINIKAYIPLCRNLSYEKTKPYVMSYEEIKLLFKEIDNYTNFRIKSHYCIMFSIFFRLLYTTGIRNGEACNIKIKDLNLDNYTIKVYEAKNNKERIVYLSLDMALLIKEYITKIKINSEWLFPNEKNTGHIAKTTVDKRFSYYVKKAKIGNEKFHPVPHSLRHTYVVHRIDKWTNDEQDTNEMINYLSKQLGHSSINETHYYYHMLESSFSIIKSKDRNIIPEVINNEK